MKISILTDNIANKRNILAEHGLSLFIENGDRTVLFDTGQSDIYLRNASVMGLHPEAADIMVLSHGHYDHCGGLKYFKPFSAKSVPLYIHPLTFAPRYRKLQTREGGNYVDIGAEIEAKADSRFRIISGAGITRISQDTAIFSETPYSNDFEEPPGHFCVEKSKGNISRDFFADEQALVIKTEKGLIVFLGCSHPGPVNMITYILNNNPGEKIFALFAGMHLDGVPKERLDKTIDLFIALGMEMVVPLHCTGIRAICRIKDALGPACSIMAAGDSMTL
ncbi:MAG: MBL fold metallo-hydrolase [Eubacteriales bacterium]|nr:MBL fold metallo-hydrolase [Eubacteriales bacterium]